jgi:hypothetical protein
VKTCKDNGCAPHNYTHMPCRRVSKFEGFCGGLPTWVASNELHLLARAFLVMGKTSVDPQAESVPGRAIVLVPPVGPWPEAYKISGLPAGSDASPWSGCA